jgi:hypothetical protein
MCTGLSNPPSRCPREQRNSSLSHLIYLLSTNLLAHASKMYIAYIVCNLKLLLARSYPRRLIQPSRSRYYVHTYKPNLRSSVLTTLPFLSSIRQKCLLSQGILKYL